MRPKSCLVSDQTHRSPLVEFPLQATFHEEDWKTWKELAGPAREPTDCFFRGHTEQVQKEAASQCQAAAHQERDHHHSVKGNANQHTSHTAEATATSTSTSTDAKVGSNATAALSLDPTSSEDDERHYNASVGGSARAENSSRGGSRIPESSTALKDAPVKISHPTPDPPAYKGSAADQAKIERLCQAIADRVEVRTEGRGGKLALRAPRRGGGHAGASGGRDGDTGQEEGEEGEEDGEGDGEREGGGGRSGLGPGGLGLGSADVGKSDTGKVGRGRVTGNGRRIRIA